MKMISTPKRIVAFFAAVSLLLSTAGCSSDNEKVSEPFNYAGYSKAEYKSYEKTSEYVEMSDGTKLAVDIYLPSKEPDTESFPVIFQYTPYGRAYIVPDSKFYEKIAMKFVVGTGGPVLDRANSKDTVYGSTADMVKLFLSHGYAYVCADMRGTGASYGHKIDFMPEFAEDEAEMISWISEQSWSDGTVGMFGGSYLGYSQLVTVAKAPEH